ncbi:hypothetical protein [Pseudoxanthomonas sp. 10H]|uniref:hypothetical protein n=1 Tax=Pseudoxanthomonas sp. 10H TaxID=3242729 RepID=UPI0035583885
MARATPLLLASCLSVALVAACDRKYDTPTATPSPQAAAAATTDPAAAPAPAPVTTATSPPVGDPAAPPPTAVDTGTSYPAAREACLAEVARQTAVPKEQLAITEVLWAQAGVGVTVQVPGMQAPWSCLSDEQGKVQGAASTAPPAGG